jgi:FkbM family methyltransferase
MPSRLHRLWNRRVGAADAGVEQRYACGPCEIVLPPDHKLPEYQRRHPRYDRFLPHLAAYIPATAAVIDVGANCGDTVAAMVGGNARLHYLCIEPDETFYRYLRGNLERLAAARPGIRIDTVRALVGKQVQSASLEGEGGTKHARPGPGGEIATTVDRIVEGRLLPPVWLLKSDVDGFDSAMGVIARDHPVLFFECQPLTEQQKSGFASLLPCLGQAGYTHWSVFDNFGELMLRDVEPLQIEQLMEYVWRQHQGQATRTIYYCDILASTERDAPRVAEALDSY